MLVAEADLLGQVGVGGERERHPRLDDQRGEGVGRVELADRLAQPRGGELDRRAALDYRFDRGLVEAAQVPLRQRSAVAPPDLDQVRVGEDVEEAGAGAAAEVIEVPRPDLLRVAAPSQTSKPSWSTAASPSPTKWTEPTT